MNGWGLGVDVKIKSHLDLEPIPSVSVIIPMFNAALFIESCLKSLELQSVRNFEVLVIDDGSTDDSLKLAKCAMPKVRFTSIINTSNFGVTHARNLGLARAKGKYVFFLDADDTLEPNSLELLLDQVEQSQFDMVIGNYSRRPNGTLYGTDIDLNKSLIISDEFLKEYAFLYLSNPKKHPLLNNIWGRLYSSRIISKFNIKFSVGVKVGEDLAFNYEFIRHTSRIYFVNSRLYNYRIHNSTQSATMTPELDAILLRHAVDSIASFLVDSGEDPIKVEKATALASVHLAITGAVRLGSMFNKLTIINIYKLIIQLTNHRIVRLGLEYYERPNDGSILIPFLMKRKFYSILILVLIFRGFFRYSSLMKWSRL